MSQATVEQSLPSFLQDGREGVVCPSSHCEALALMPWNFGRGARSEDHPGSKPASES